MGEATACCRTPDGERILSLHGGTFYWCNLKARTVQQWDAPEAFGRLQVTLHVVERR